MPDDEIMVSALQNEVGGWRRLARRLVNQGPMLGPMIGGPQAELYLGTLPDRLPYDLPVPPERRIVGSVADEGTATIYLDTDRSPDEVLQFYRERMQAPEWDVIEPHMPMQSGFVPTMHDSGLLFCQGPKGPSLRVHAQYGDAATDVMLQVVSDPRWSPCQGQPRYNPVPGAPMPHQVGPQERLPALRAPANAMMQPTGGGGAPFYQYSTAQLQTALDLGAVADHFTAEMEKAGCSRGDAGQEGRAAWSTWTVPTDDGETRPGLFIALRIGEGTSKRYYLYLHAGSP
jgi:hypothetical protein